MKPSIENKFKNQVIDLVDQHFPKGNKQRGNATVMSSKIMMKLEPLLIDARKERHKYGQKQGEMKIITRVIMHWEKENKDFKTFIVSLKKHLSKLQSSR